MQDSAPLSPGTILEMKNDKECGISIASVSRHNSWECADGGDQRTLAAASEFSSKTPNANEGHSDNGFQTFRLIILVHTLSILITITLLVVYIKSLAWDPGPREINVLLIASKVYENLILASLSTILLHRIRACLKSSQGIPLGFLASPFQLSSAYYPFSKQFWKAATKSASNDKGEVTTRIFVLIIVVLALATGPSTSIVMLPKLDWWAVSGPDSRAGYKTGGMVDPVLVEAILPDMYPNFLDSGCFNVSCPSLPRTKRDSPEYPPSLESACPSAAASQILNNLPQILGSDHLKEYVFNYSIGGMDHIRDISIGWQFEESTGNDALAYATSPLDIVSRELHFQGNEFWQQFHRPVKITSQAVQYSIQKTWVHKPDSSGQVVQELIDVATSTNTQWHQPALAVHCSEIQEKDETYKASFSPGGPFSPSLSHFELPQNSVGSMRQISNRTTLSFIDIGGHLPASVSTAFLSQSDGSITFCLVAAKWVLTDVWISKPVENSAQSSFSVDPSIAVKHGFPDLSDLITISADWANSLNTAITYTPDPASSATRTIGAFERLHAICEKDKRTRCLAIAFSLYLTDALSRLQHSWAAYSCKGDLFGTPPAPLSCLATRGADEGEIIQIRPPDLQQYTGIAVSYYRYQYAYGILGTTESIAWLILLLHLLLVVTHLSEHYLRKKTYTAKGWLDVGELVALALRADSPDVIRGGGLKEPNTDTWRLRTFISDKGDCGQPEIVLRRTAGRQRRDHGDD